MSTLNDIKESIQEMAGINGKANNMVFDAEVKAVSDEYITIESDGMELTQVRTCATTNGNKQNFRIYPKVGSSVVCLDLAGDRRDIIVIQYSEIDRVSIHEGKHTTANADELLKQLKNLTDRVDALYNAINYSAFGTADGGKVLQANMQAYLVGKQSEDYSKIEDKTLKH